MIPGTPGFIGERLREAREARGLTAIALADLVGVTRQAISHYESTKSPRPEIMQKISEVLGLPESFFRRRIIRSETGTVFYRSMSSATKASRLRAEKRFGWLMEIAEYLQAYFEYPPVNFPQFSLPDQPVKISTDQIEDIALQTRLFWNLGDGPIGNMVSLLENNGAIIFRDELGADTLDAFSAFSSKGIPYICLGSDKAVCVRSRFDAGHELGHLILHRTVNKSLLTKQTEFRLLEEQAHRFASAFLFPSQSFAMEFYSASLDTFKVLKPKWKVSIAMMIKRASELELVSPEQAKRLWIAYTRRKWRNAEPLDDELEIEYPKLMKRSIELLINQKIKTPEDILHQLPFNPHDIEVLVGSTGSLTSKVAENDPPLRVKKFPDRSRSNIPSISNKPGEVLKFPDKNKPKV
jgi:Zn-dependent peptidase ImmA (M78 family)/transcriptional regulator with XRE-family HTH domain